MHYRSDYSTASLHHYNGAIRHAKCIRSLQIPTPMEYLVVAEPLFAPTGTAEVRRTTAGSACHFKNRIEAEIRINHTHVRMLTHVRRPNVANELARTGANSLRYYSRSVYCGGYQSKL
jgi:hypothetical protein